MQIYLSSLSLRETIKRNRLAVYDLPKFVVDQGYAGVELQDRELVGFSQRRIERLARCAQQAHCGMVFDIGCDLTISNEEMWRSEVDHAIHSIRNAQILGAPVVRISLGGQTFSIQNLIRRIGVISHRNKNQVTINSPKPSLLKVVLQSQPVQVAARHARMSMPTKVARLEAKINRAVEALRIIMPQAQSCGVQVAIENHWGITGRPEWIMRIIKRVGDSNLGVCLDFGNFPSNVDRYQASEILAQRLFHVQAKCWRFNAQGEETSIDYGKLMRILRERSYDRVVSVEYEGGQRELEACRTARELIRKYW